MTQMGRGITHTHTYTVYVFCAGAGKCTFAVLSPVGKANPLVMGDRGRSFKIIPCNFRRWGNSFQPRRATEAIFT